MSWDLESIIGSNLIETFVIAYDDSAPLSLIYDHKAVFLFIFFLQFYKGNYGTISCLRLATK